MTSGLRIVREIASFLRGGGGAVRQDGKIPVTVIMGTEFHRQLLGRAFAAAHAVGIERSDIACGNFVADHVSVSLEDAYESQKISDPLSPAGGDETSSHSPSLGASPSDCDARLWTTRAGTAGLRHAA